MSVPELIRKKRDGEELTDDELHSFVIGVTDGTVQDCQAGAMLMAMYIRGMSNTEAANLTKHMAQSGDLLTWDPLWNDLLVDKHSTGGVGDKVSLPLAPALAALGLKVPMISGRGLQFTGGTLDKLESIPGFKVVCTFSALKESLEKAGCFIAGATGSLAPADKQLYQIRDVTATVGCTPLIVASIISKKVAEGTRSLVMDIKVGKAAFYKTVEEARTLAHQIINVSRGLAVPTSVALTRMDVPIGRTVGNALEVEESVMCLRGEGPEDLKELVETLGALLLQNKGRTTTLEDGKKLVRGVLESGKALKCFQVMLECQGVSKETAQELCHGDIWKVLPHVPGNQVTKLLSHRKGIITDIDAMSVAMSCWKLGAGRSRADQDIDHRVGIRLLKTVGEEVEREDPVLAVYHATQKLDQKIQQELEASITIQTTGLDKVSRIIEIIKYA